MSSKNTVVSHKYCTNTMGGINKKEALHKKSPISLTNIASPKKKTFQGKAPGFHLKSAGSGGLVFMKMMLMSSNFPKSECIYSSQSIIHLFLSSSTTKGQEEKSEVTGWTRWEKCHWDEHETHGT